ncbi:hypothetical protein [Burkholderia cepacia]|uniref:hypothetical protein n=1 Tax=Burkholderia cepacia TaxID=292 RepID=UPI00158A5B89|nr:hypothetical protein [Burkholderia cepacia]
MLLNTGKPKPVSDGGHRKFEMTYDAEKRTLTAAVCIEVELLDLHHINQFTGQAAVRRLGTFEKRSPRHVGMDAAT